MTGIASWVIIITLLKGATAPITPDIQIGSLNYHDDAWLDYINKQVELDDYDKEKARTAKDDTPEVVSEIFTHFDEPPSFRKEPTGLAPFVSLIYNLRIVKQDGQGGWEWSVDTWKVRACGGAVLTRNVVMTLCMCVHTFLFFLDKASNPNSKFTGQAPVTLGDYDLGPPPLYVQPFSENIFNTKPNRPLLSRYKIELKNTEGGDTKKGYTQFRNSACMKIITNIENEGATKDVTNYIKELTRTIAILEYSPQLETYVPEWFVPWPPVVITYDARKNNSKHRNGLGRGRNIQTVTIYGYGFVQYLNKTPYRTEDGTPVDTYRSIMAIRMSLCEQYYCSNRFNKTFVDSKGVELDYESLGCFCDTTDRDDANTLCKGMIGSPALYEGILYGLVTENLRCEKGAPRAYLIRGFTNKHEQRVTDSIPDLLLDVHNVEVLSFRGNSSLLEEYSQFVPHPDIMPDLEQSLQNEHLKLEKRSRARGYSSNIHIPIIIYLVYQISIYLQVNRVSK